ncbi:MAG: hypothetical protein A2W91_12615 [Bacteroidetes bacterium GWF2_38_335]|nr:MAG: hypothetical protein A2W91_12615 [Bacteroidetes bacterium GWF2_38_335]OFY77009.1 MAG: hypothetical protein A2281_00730 [Bacteroidetes bacterium RIFOXYA12_FULL_38_20]HBS86867.1 hypothetical protein [Bacteroidales bacterium]
MKIILKFICFLYTVGVFSQSPHFINFSSENGLPSNEVYHVFQDSKGYIWFATNNGVCKYDGENFTNFDMENGLPDNTVFEIYEDYKGRIWFVTFSSKLSYYYNGKIIPYKYNNLIQSIPNNTPNPLKNCFFVDENDNIILESFNLGTVRISNEGKIKVEETPFNKNVVWEYKGKIIPKTRLFVPEITFKLSSDTFSFKYDASLYNTEGYSYAEKLKNKYLLAKGKLLFVFEKGKDVDYVAFENKIVWMGIDQAGLIWFGLLKNGVVCFNNTDFLTEKHHFLNDYSVTSVLKDNSGGYWFTTVEQGVFYTPSKEIITYSVESKSKINQVNTVLPLEDEVYIGLQNNGLVLLKNQSIKKININGQYDFNVYNLGMWNDILTVSSDKSFLVYNGKGKRENVLINNKKSLLYTGISSAIINEDSMLYTTTTGLFIVTPDSINKIMYKYYNSRADAIINDGNGRFLIGAINGLYSYDYRNNQLNYLSEANDSLKVRVLDIVKNKDIYYLATKGNGLILLKKNKILSKITKKEGLSSNIINSLFYSNGALWAATNSGLNKIVFKKGNFNSPDITIISKSHGLPSDNIHEVKIRDSLIYLATSEGLAILNVKTVRNSHNHPPVYVKRIEINGKQVEAKDKYMLDYNENSIFISFISLNYKLIEKKIYKYKLIGVDTKWNIGTENSARYSSLKPGTYKFIAYSLNEDREWSKKPLVIEFEILTPYWDTLWFKLLIWILALCVVGFIFLVVYKLRMKNIKKTIMLNQELNLYRQKSLTQQMNPHFLFNSLNSIQYFIYKNDKEKSAEYLSKFSLLLRLILENSQQQQIPIRREIQAIELYLELESLRFRGDFKYEIIIDSLVEADFLMIPTLIIQPFVENAIWHGLLHKLEGNKKLVIHISREDDLIICSVEDNGIGRVKSREINERQKSHESLGTKITKNRLQLINSLYGNQLNLKYIDLMDGSGNPIGTKVVLNLPVIK